MSRAPASSPATPQIRRGDVWWVDFDPARGGEIQKRRPAMVLTADGLNRARRTVVVVPLSTGPASRPPIIVPTPSAGVGSVAVCDQLRAVDKSRLTAQVGRLAVSDIRGVEQGVRTVLGL